MLTTTRDMIMPTAITGSYPRPLWFDASLQGRSFKAALGDSLFREQYLDAVAAVINAQEAAGLDIVTDRDSRFDLAVGVCSPRRITLSAQGSNTIWGICDVPWRRYRDNLLISHD